MSSPTAPIDYDELGAGTTVLLVPGSCSTGAAWRAVRTRLDGYRTVTTTLPGYGGTIERRSGTDASIDRIAESIEAVVERAGGPVHVVGHSFGGLAALAAALRSKVPLASLMILEAPAPSILEADAPDQYRVFRTMTDAYAADFRGGNAEAIASMIDFYGGAGTFAAWPEAVRSYAARTTSTNLLDWVSAYGFDLPGRLDALDLPVTVVAGGLSNPAVVRANELIAGAIENARFKLFDGAAHFMIATHPDRVATMIVEHLIDVERR